MTTVDTVYAVGLASCPCGKAWWAVSEEERGTARLSGLACPACNEARGRYVGSRSVVPTMREAIAEAERMRQENLDVMVTK